MKKALFLGILIAILAVTVISGCGRRWTAVQKGGIGGALVENGTGSPISGATVTNGSTSTTTATDGSFSLTGIEPGTYTVTATKTGWVSTSESVTVNEEQNSTVTLKTNLSGQNINSLSDQNSASLAKSMGGGGSSISSSSKSSSSVGGSLSGLSVPLATTPTITGLSATIEAVGYDLIVSGSNFGNRGLVVFAVSQTSYFYGVPISWTNTSITVKVPSGYTSFPANCVVVVQTIASDGSRATSSAFNSFTITSDPGNAAIINTISPTLEASGKSITLTGSRFGADGIINLNKVGNVAETQGYTLSDGTTATFTSPKSEPGSCFVYITRGTFFSNLVELGITGAPSNIDFGGKDSDGFYTMTGAGAPTTFTLKIKFLNAAGAEMTFPPSSKPAKIITKISGNDPVGGGLMSMTMEQIMTPISGGIYDGYYKIEGSGTITTVSGKTITLSNIIQYVDIAHPDNPPIAGSSNFAFTEGGKDYSGDTTNKADGTMTGNVYIDGILKATVNFNSDGTGTYTDAATGTVYSITK